MTPTVRWLRPQPAPIELVVLVGATCTGKSTVAAAVAASDLARDGRVDVLTRFVTRPPRRDDAPGENEHVTPDELGRRIAGGKVSMYWRRALGPERVERYAFARITPGRLAVAVANPAILETGNVQPPHALDHALLVGLVAPDSLRERRLVARSPELVAAHPDEVCHRLAERADRVLPHVHVVLDNHGAHEAVAPGKFVELVRTVAMSPARARRSP
jgi:ribose 1,5-bisphosphokinase PhnN